MKKIIPLLILLFVYFSLTCNIYAKGMGIKCGYVNMMDDYNNDGYNNTWSVGAFFDMGTFIFNSLKFRPGLDYICMKDDGNVPEFDIWGIHLDWYWFFLDSSGSLDPFLGFSTALNYYNYEDSSTEEDSDAGIEGFAGIDYNLSGPLSLTFEFRFLIHDIADRNAAILKGSIGALYSF